MIPFRRTHAGLGRSSFKFLPGPPPGTPNSDAGTNTATSTGTPVTTANASGRWSASVTTVGPLSIFRATHNVTATVNQPKGGPAGEAVAESTDPIEVEYDAPGTLDFTYFLSDVSLFSDSDMGEAIFSTGVGFTGVTFNGNAIDGDLFQLGIGVYGISSSIANVDVIFEPADELMLDIDDITAIESYIFSFLSLLPDGSIGFSPGTSVPVFGQQSPLGVLNLNHNENLTYDTFATSSARVPEPASLALLTVGLVCLRTAMRRSRKSPVTPSAMK